jgi:hypothetical protein
LAEILPLESADMVYVHTTDLEGDEHYNIDFRNNQPLFEDDIPAWNLAALLGVIPKHIKDYNVLRIDISENEFAIWYDEIGCGVNNELPDITKKTAIDACYEMILKLHELNLL